MKKVRVLLFTWTERRRIMPRSSKTVCRGVPALGNPPASQGAEAIKVKRRTAPDQTEIHAHER